MKLYHGTSEQAARIIIESKRIAPRSVIRGKSNWEHTVESNPSTVYLTETYPAYFAANATKGDEKWAIIEIDVDKLDQDLLVADEDYLEQATRDTKDRLGLGYISNEEMKKRTEAFRERAKDFRHMWRASVEGLGTCGYMGTILLDAVTKVVTYAPKSNRLITLASIDPSITIANHKFCGDRYRALVRWFMGKNITLREFYGMSWDIQKEMLTPRDLDEVNCELCDRTGYEVIFDRERKESNVEVSQSVE